MSALYLPSDVPVLVRLATLYEAHARGELPPSAGHVLNAIEDRFGLSPKARAQLAWQLSPAERPVAGKPSSDVRRLRAVDPSAADDAFAEVDEIASRRREDLSSK